MPFNNEYNNHMRKFMKLYDPYTKIDVSKLECICKMNSMEKFKRIYQDLLSDIITGLCDEGSFEYLWKYHFTEMDKELYLLKQLYKLVPDRKYTETNCMKMITVLNETMFIYEKGDEKLSDDSNSVLYKNESKAIALEYLTKLDLLSNHTSRMNYFRNMFETSLNNILNITKNNYENLMNNMTLKTQYNDNLSPLENANIFLKKVFIKYIDESAKGLPTAMSNASNEFANLFNILPTLV